jgi:hypothetical protein
MTYLEETEHWIDDLFVRLANEGLSVEAAKLAIRERILQSFKNGLKAKPRVQKPVNQPSPERA